MTLLQLLKAGGEIRLKQGDKWSPVVRMSSVQRGVIVAEQPKVNRREQFRLTNAGIQKALDWAATGYVMRVEKRGYRNSPSPPAPLPHGEGSKNPHPQPVAAAQGGG